MKKLIAMLLVAVMCLSFVACGNTEVNDASINDNNEEKSEIVGTWNPSNDSVLAGYTIVFSEDGTGTIKDTKTRWKYDDELSCYIVANASGEVYSIFEILTDDSGERYFKLSGMKFYYQD